MGSVKSLHNVAFVCCPVPPLISITSCVFYVLMRFWLLAAGEQRGRIVCGHGGLLAGARARIPAAALQGVRRVGPHAARVDPARPRLHGRRQPAISVYEDIRSGHWNMGVVGRRPLPHRQPYQTDTPMN